MSSSEYHQPSTMHSEPENGCETLDSDSPPPSYYESGYKFCPEQWDGYICWPRTREGKTAFQKCSDPGTYVYMPRDCQWGGVWSNTTSATECGPTDLPLPSEDGSTNSSYLDDNYDHDHEQQMLYEDYERMTEAGRVLNCIAIVLAVLALVIWIVVWIKRRHTSPYRYAVFTLIFASLVLKDVPELVLNAMITTHTKALCIFFHVYGSSFNLLLSCALFTYLVFCAIMLLRRFVSSAQIFLGILAAVVFSLIFAIVFIIVLAIYPEEHCILFAGKNKLPYILMVPNFVVLILVVCLGLGLLVCSFVLRKTSRDHRLIRYSSLTVLLTALYHSADQIVNQFERTVVEDTDLTGRDYLNFLTARKMLFSCRAIVFALLLCFLDLEVLSMCPCACVELNDGLATTLEFLPLAKPEATGPERDDKSHVSAFRMDITRPTPRTDKQGKQLYGAIPERR